jgi:CheY-like chemotaxis protein
MKQLLQALLVEDYPGLLRVSKKTLERLGYTVVTASTMIEAEKAIKSHLFDLALIDLEVPERSKDKGVDKLGGVKIAKRLAEQSYGSSTKIFIYSGKFPEEEEKVRQKIAEMGLIVSGYISKNHHLLTCLQQQLAS